MADTRTFDLADYYPAREAIRYSLTRRGFFSEFNVLVFGYAFALTTGRHIFVDQQKLPTPWGELFRDALPAIESVDPGRYDRVIDLHPKGFRAEWNDMRRTIRDACFRRDHVSVPGFGFDGPIDELIFTLADWLFTPRQELVDEALAAERALGLDRAPFCAVQLRRGDKTEGYLNAKGRLVVETAAVPFEAYAQRIARIAPDVRDVFVLTDDYGEFEAARQSHPDFRFHTLCGESERGYFHFDHLDRSLEEQLSNVRKLLVTVILARRSAAFVGTHWSNLSTGVYMLHPHRARCACVDEDEDWSEFDPMFLRKRPSSVGDAEPSALLNKANA